MKNRQIARFLRLHKKIVVKDFLLKMYLECYTTNFGKKFQVSSSKKFSKIRRFLKSS